MDMEERFMKKALILTGILLSLVGCTKPNSETQETPEPSTPLIDNGNGAGPAAKSDLSLQEQINELLSEQASLKSQDKELQKQGYRSNSPERKAIKVRLKEIAQQLRDLKRQVRSSRPPSTGNQPTPGTQDCMKVTTTPKMLPSSVPGYKQAACVSPRGAGGTNNVYNTGFPGNSGSKPYQCAQMNVPPCYEGYPKENCISDDLALNLANGADRAMRCGDPAELNAAIAAINSTGKTNQVTDKSSYRYQSVKPYCDATKTAEDGELLIGDLPFVQGGSVKNPNPDFTDYVNTFVKGPRPESNATTNCDRPNMKSFREANRSDLERIWCASNQGRFYGFTQDAKGKICQKYNIAPCAWSPGKSIETPSINFYLDDGGYPVSNCQFFEFRGVRTLEEARKRQTTDIENDLSDAFRHACQYDDVGPLEARVNLLKNILREIPFNRATQSAWRSTAHLCHFQPGYNPGLGVPTLKCANAACQPHN